MTKRGFNCQRDVICGNSHVFSKAIEEPISFRVLGQALIFPYASSVRKGLLQRSPCGKFRPDIIKPENKRL
ncbi:hypothetical protein [Leptospira santarosai]|nr:hypothetical protein [Leptospira santarosai]EMO23653.1 hypothetical protein LEP1GSC168_1630 [Leptospira santarosai str. HAI134]